MTRPQFSDGRMTSNMEGTCEYIEYADTDSNVEKELREKIKRWRQKAGDREEWASVINEPKAVRQP